MTSEDEHVSLYYRSPEDIRHESFTHRIRGLDESEVREYLDLLADQVEAFVRERTEMVAEVERLRARDEQVKERPQNTPSPVSESTPEGGNAQVAAVLSQAQDVADQLLADASRQAQEIVETAQRQGREVVRRARLRTRDQMQSLYDELDAEFHHIGEALRPSGQDRLPAGPARQDI